MALPVGVMIAEARKGCGQRVCSPSDAALGSEIPEHCLVGQCPVETTSTKQPGRQERALWLFDSCPRASFGTPCKYSSFVCCHLGTSAEEKGTDNRGKAVVGKLSTVCEQCPQVSHERSNKGGGK